MAVGAPSTELATVVGVAPEVALSLMLLTFLPFTVADDFWTEPDRGAANLLVLPGVGVVVHCQTPPALTQAWPSLALT